MVIYMIAKKRAVQQTLYWSCSLELSSVWIGLQSWSKSRSNCEHGYTTRPRTSVSRRAWWMNTYCDCIHSATTIITDHPINHVNDMVYDPVRGLCL